MNKYKYKIYADAVAWFHLSWYVVFFASFPLAFIYPDLRFWIITFIVVTAVSIAIWRACPFRIWENNLRRKYDSKTVYKGNFTSHYLGKVFGIKVSVYTVRIVLWGLMGLLVLLSLLA